MLSQTILQLIKQSNLSVLEVSRRSSVHSNTIYNWQKGRIPTVNAAEKVLNALGYSVEIKKQHKQEDNHEKSH